MVYGAKYMPITPWKGWRSNFLKQKFYKNAIWQLFSLGVFGDFLEYLSRILPNTCRIESDCHFKNPHRNQQKIKKIRQNLEKDGVVSHTN